MGWITVKPEQEPEQTKASRSRLPPETKINKTLLRLPSAYSGLAGKGFWGKKNVGANRKDRSGAILALLEI